MNIETSDVHNSARNAYGKYGLSLLSPVQTAAKSRFFSWFRPIFESCFIYWRGTAVSSGILLYASWWFHSHQSTFVSNHWPTNRFQTIPSYVIFAVPLTFCSKWPPMLQSEIHFTSNDVIIDRIPTPSHDQVCENETYTINHVSSPR
jgi:hypothetical protein